MRGPSRPATPSTRQRPRAKKVRVLGVAHPPDGEIVEEQLEEATPYFTDASIKDWLSGRGGAADDETSDLMVFVSILAMGALGKELMAGAYGGTKSNPLFAMEVFLAHNAMGLYPPLWVLDWLNEAFADYLKADGKGDFSALLGVKRGKGQRTIFDEARAVNAEVALLREIAFLNALGAPISEAAEMVAGRLKAVGCEPLSAETMADRFSKRQWRAYVDLIKDALSTAPLDELIRQIKKNYPPHTLPNRWN